MTLLTTQLQKFLLGHFTCVYVKKNLPDCRWPPGGISYPQLVYPGETFQISVFAAGQRKGTVSSTVRSTAITRIIDIQLTAMNNNHPVNLLDYQYLQQTNNTTKLNYTVFTVSGSGPSVTSRR